MWYNRLILKERMSKHNVSYCKATSKTSKGTFFNADVNETLNILKKSNVVSLDALYNSGEVDTPIRIRIA